MKAGLRSGAGCQAEAACGQSEHIQAESTDGMYVLTSGQELPSLCLVVVFKS